MIDYRLGKFRKKLNSWGDKSEIANTKIWKEGVMLSLGLFWTCTLYWGSNSWLHMSCVVLFLLESTALKLSQSKECTMEVDTVSFPHPRIHILFSSPSRPYPSGEFVFTLHSRTIYRNEDLRTKNRATNIKRILFYSATNAGQIKNITVVYNHLWNSKFSWFAISTIMHKQYHHH